MSPTRRIVRPNVSPNPNPQAAPQPGPAGPQQFTPEQQLFRAQVMIAELERRCTEGRTRELHLSANVAMLQSALQAVTAERDALKTKYEPEEKTAKGNGKSA
jgi:hypothetical protein